MIDRVIWAKNVARNAKKKKQKQKRPPKSLKNQMFIFGLLFNFWWSVKQSEQKTLTENVKKWKRPPKSLKNQMFIFGLHSTSEWSAKWSKQKTSTEMQNNKKGPLSHQKIKCSFLDYIQLLIISRAIWVKNVNQNAKKQKRSPKSLKNQMFIFGLCSASNDQPSNLSKKHWPKCKKT